MQEQLSKDCAEARKWLQDTVVLINSLEKRIEELEIENRELRKKLGQETEVDKEFTLEEMALEELGLKAKTFSGVIQLLGMEAKVSDVICHPLSEYMKVHNFGEGCACDLINKLDCYGLELKEETNPNSYWKMRAIYESAKAKRTDLVDLGLSVEICERANKLRIYKVEDLGRFGLLRTKRLNLSDNEIRNMIVLLEKKGFPSIAKQLKMLQSV